MLQVVLLFLAGVRRHKSGGVRMGILWLAYQLADYITTYAMGNLAGSSALPKHRLVAFWGPFLLLHLGGPDNIAAYELEDNKLWKRQILTLVGQGLGAGYVLYKHISGGGGGALFSLAAIFVAVVGFVKFCEKIFALRHASLSTIRDSVRTETPANCTVFLEYELPRWGLFVRNKEELLKRHAHALFHVCKSAMVDSSVDDLGPNRSNHGGATRLLKDFKNQDAKYRWTLMEMELSLMYDILYTKAAMVHSLPGYCIRVSSSLVVAASLLLFQFSSKAGYSGVDIAITYALLAGAFLLEVKSLLSAVFSTWTFAFLCTTRWSRLRHAILCSGRWDRFRRLVVSLHLLAYVKTIADYLRLSKRWHGTIGQSSMLDMCIRGLSVSDSRLRAWMLGSRTWTVNVPKMVKERVVEHIDGIIKKDDINTLGVIRLNWGVMALKHHNFEVEEARLGAEVQEGIVIWHIATDILLAGMGKLGTKDTDVKAIKAISQYMMFLLVERPAMLPGLAQIKLYQRTERTLANQCEGAINLSPASWRDGGPSSVSRLERREELANRLRDDKPKLDELGISSRVVFAVDLAKKLRKREEQNKDSLQIVLDVWIDILVYTANRCSRESHAMQLSRGGEFTTLIWLMAEHYHQAGFQQ